MSSKDAVVSDSSDKRRRKAVIPAASPNNLTIATPQMASPAAAPVATAKPEDVYTTTIRSEELESTGRSGDLDSSLFHAACSDFRTMLADCVQLKLAAASAATTDKLAERRIDGSHAICLLKKLNRMDKIRQRCGREALHREKLAVDSQHLQLQNLLYEAEHLRREVQRCFQFKSHDEAIQLVPEEQFYAEAPAAIARPAETRSDEHTRRLARLEWELAQRKQLAAMCTELQRQKELAAEQIGVQSERLEALAPRLEALLRATRPLQEALGQEVESQWKVARVARLLPAPLYMAYANLCAYAEACDPRGLSARIVGDESDVLDDIEDDDLMVLESGGGDEADSTPGPTEPDDEAMESDGDGSGEQRQRQRRSHHHHRRAEAEAHEAPEALVQPASKTSTDEAQLDRLLRPHPLSVTFELRSRQPAADNAAAPPPLAIQLRYLAALNLVTVQCSASGEDATLAPNALLTALAQPEDTGALSPNPKTHYQLRAVNADPQQLPALLAAKKLGTAYGWAQRLCGLDWQGAAAPAVAAATAAPEAGVSLEVTQNAVPRVVAQIRRRWQTRLRLGEQIRQLQAQVQAPSAVAAVLLAWQPIGWTEFAQQPAARRFVEAGQPGVVCGPSDLFYAVRVARGAVARFECAVRVSVQHPRVLPLWAVTFYGSGAGGVEAEARTASTNAVVREIECWVNSVTAGDGPNVLATQLRRACSSLDIYLETTDGAMGAGVRALAQEKTFLRAFRGRMRSRPLRAIETSAGRVIYTQV